MAVPNQATDINGEMLSEMRLPADWEPQAAIWLAWPHNHETWPGRFGPVPKFFGNLTRLIAEDTSVRILAHGEVARDAEKILTALPANVDLVPIKTNDCWIRDYGPMFVENRSTNKIEAVDWRYNAWGGKYPPWDDDDAVAKQICQHLAIQCHRSEMCLEGGTLETDGDFRLMTFTDCVQTDSRNPNWSNERIVQELYRRLGILETVWIDGGGIQGDDTDGHIDQLARFVDPENIVVASCSETTDSNAPALIANFRQFDLWARQTEPIVQIHKLPIPPARYIKDVRVPESYCNFLRLGKTRMLVPTFGDSLSDDRALGILKELCPDTDIIGIDCRDLVWGLGALHCASLNQPASA